PSGAACPVCRRCAYLVVSRSPNRQGSAPPGAGGPKLSLVVLGTAHAGLSLAVSASPGMGSADVADDADGVDPIRQWLRHRLAPVAAIRFGPVPLSQDTESELSSG